MLIEKLYKFLDSDINLSQFENWVYECVELEKLIGEGNYHFLLTFNYNDRISELNVKDFIFANIINKEEFIDWKIDTLLSFHKIRLPNENLFLYAKQNPSFLKGKKFKFQSYRAGMEAEIFWENEIHLFEQSSLEINKNDDEYLYLGTYEKTYIDLLVNKKDEIWIYYVIINEKKFFAKNIKEAIRKIFTQKI